MLHAHIIILIESYPFHFFFSAGIRKDWFEIRKEKKGLLHVDSAFGALVHTGFAVNTVVDADYRLVVDKFDRC